MSVYATLDGEMADQLGSNKGWSDFRAWVETLEGAEDLKHLCDAGWDEDLDLVEAQLKEALDASPPEASVKSTAGNLLNILSKRGAATVLTTSDGFGE